MNIFVTGASGFLGKVVLRRLVSAKHNVVALSRSQPTDELITKMGATPVRGDLSDADTLGPVLQNIDVVVHCAAPVDFWAPWEKYEKGILNATVDLAELSAKSGVKKFIHISSESVLQDKLPLMDINEDFSYPEIPNSYYGLAKKMAEEFLLKTNFKMEVIIIRPTFIWGNGSSAFEQIKSKVQSGQFVWVNSGKASFEAVHVENVAEAVVQALTNGKDRGVYFVTDDEASTVKEFFSKVFESLGLKMPTKSIPGFVAGIAAQVIERLWKLARISSAPPLTRFDLAFVNMPRRYNITKAKTELGYRPIVSRKDGFALLQKSIRT